MKCSTIRTIDKQIEKVWDELTNIPFDEDTTSNDSSYLVLGEDYHIWKKGTERDIIWCWFDNNHSKGVAWLLNEREG